MTKLSQNGMWFQQASKIPDAYWSLLKIFRPHEIKIKGEGWWAHKCAAILCIFWPNPQSDFFSQDPDQVLRECWTKYSFLEASEPQRKASSWGIIVWKQTWLGETLGASLQTTEPTSFLHQLFAPKNGIWVLLGSFPIISEENTNRKESLGKPKGGDWDFQMTRHSRHWYLKLVNYLVSILQSLKWAC